MTGNVVAIVQARLGSSRLPLKSLLNLAGRPIIDWVTGRLQQSRRLDRIIVAVPDTPLDQVLLTHLRSKGVECMAGPENDVLRRFALASELAGADYIVRICADNPLVWGEAIDRLVDFYVNSECDYAWNHIPRDNLWPDGLGAEIISADLLRELDRKAQLPQQREHCFNFIWDNAADFVMKTFDPVETWLCRPDLKLDIDSVADYQRLALLPINPGSDAAAIVAACPPDM